MLLLDDDTRALRTLADWVRWGASRFREAGLVFAQGSENALDEAYFLVLHALRLPEDLPAAYLSTQLTPGEGERVAALLRERVESRRPAAYLIGEIGFAGLRFEVDERVLIPRSPFAELIAHGFRPWLAAAPARVLDLCTGSGCIGIATAAAFEDAEVDLADLSADALAVAARNIARHQVADRVRTVLSDGFEGLGGRRYDLIVCNPPYVPQAEWAALPPEFHHEPAMALAAGEDGMDLVARILAQAAGHLSEEGWLFCEVGGSQNEFEARWPELPVTWALFANGGDGIFCIDRPALVAYFGG
jgi:ribosomal protein L3 glutamine methyltransferase